MTRLLAMSVGLITAAGVWATPAHADALGDSFLSALNNSGVGYNNPANTVQLGQSVCPMLAQPGGTFAGVASRVAGNGISPDLAALFTSIAINMYCPGAMTSFANGDWLNSGGLPGLPFLGSAIPGLPGQ